MNYYEHHLGDYDGATAHLSWLEDCAYRRLICLYYRSEAPIPADVKQACRLVRAASKIERDAVQQVLSEFFTLQADGWHHDRCDRELSEFHEKAPDREAKRENDRERQRRSRERRAKLFEELRQHNIVPPFDAKTHDLEALLSRVTSRAVTQPVTRDNTATQTPDPRPQSPEETALAVSARDPDEPEPPQPEPPPATSRAGSVCRRMKAAGLAAVNPAHPKLTALLQAGITDDELVAAAADAAQRGKGFAYALAAAEGQRRDAATGPLPERAGITVPGPSGPDPTLVRLEADRAAWKPPAPEVRAMLAQTVARLKGAAT